VAEVEATPLRELAHHREAVVHDARMEDVHRFFSERQIDFAALVRDGRVTGICGRSQLGFLLGSRFGFALNARSPAHMAGIKRPLVFVEKTPLREVLQASLGRHDDEFYEDVALVDNEHQLIGLIPVEGLVQLQSRLVNAQLEEMRRQNVELFAAGHAVRQAQALSAGLFASDAIGVGLLSSTGRLQTCNRRLGELLGMGSQLPAELSVDSLLLESERPLWRKLLLTLEQNKYSNCAEDCELEVTGRGRRIMHFSLGWIAETSQICVCVDDITQQREIERHLQREEKQKLLDTLAGGIAHELNNKLTPVLGYAELLAHGASVAQAKYVGYIRKGVQESANIIRQLLRLAKPEGGRPEVMDLCEVIREAATMLQFQVSEARAQLRLEIGTVGLPINGDPGQLKQVVMNLALNALHAMADTAQPLLAMAAGRDSIGVYFSVRDNGTGISPEVVGRIFDPFFTTKSPDKGTGLGLSICHSIVRQHNGEIKVWSKPGEGTCFTIRLPALPAAMIPSRRSHTPFGSAAERTVGNRRVLVVEDELVIRNFLKEAVRHLYGCAVDEAADGREGLTLVYQHDYDLILSDIRMPVMTGPEFYLRLRDYRPALAGKVVFVTGHMGQDQLQEDIARWGVPVLAKPFTMDRLGQMCASRMTENIAGVA
jgi:signal transduction histidine kinase/ActR/RegA family two-component response regulator